MENINEDKGLPNNTLEVINLNDLVKAPFARDTNKNLVNKIVKDFNGLVLGIIIVARIDGVNMVIDGNNRIAAIKAMDHVSNDVYCQVLKDISREEAAELHILLNTRTHRGKKWLEAKKHEIDENMDLWKEACGN